MRVLDPYFDDLMGLVGAGTIAPVIDATYPLDRVADAFARLESGEQFGKVVVACPDPG